MDWDWMLACFAVPGLPMRSMGRCMTIKCEGQKQHVSSGPRERKDADEDSKLTKVKIQLGAGAVRCGAVRRGLLQVDWFAPGPAQLILVISKCKCPQILLNMGSTSLSPETTTTNNTHPNQYRTQPTIPHDTPSSPRHTTNVDQQTTTTTSRPNPVCPAHPPRAERSSSSLSYNCRRRCRRRRLRALCQFPGEK